MFEPVSGALIGWASKQVVGRISTAVCARRLRDRDAPEVRRALIDVVRSGVQDAVVAVFPDEPARQDFIRALLLERATDEWPLVDGTYPAELPDGVRQWVSWIESEPDEHGQIERVERDQDLAVMLCVAILERLRRSAMRGDRVLADLWHDFRTEVQLDAADARPSSAEDAAHFVTNLDHSPVGTIVQVGAAEHLHLHMGNSPSGVDASSGADRIGSWAGDGEAEQRLQRTVARQQRRVDRQRPLVGMIDRPEGAEILEILKDVEAPQVLLVDGKAGMGKSTVTAQAASQLAAEGWVVGLARMDGSTRVGTSRELGAQMELADSPSLVLADVAAGRPGLLVIDQLDAVSELSGRMPDGFEAVDEALADLRNHPNVKVLLACRTIDLERDPRLTSLLHGDPTTQRVRLNELPAEKIQAHLAAHDLHVPSAEVLELLRTPLHLSVYCRLNEASRKQPFRTLPDMYGQLTREVRQRLGARVGGQMWETMMTGLVTYMSEHEVLTAPDACLDAIHPTDTGSLVSESILERVDSGLAFFHQSYFDYLFARAFIRDGGDLHRFLVEQGQFLFRRAQTRQVLDHLAIVDRPAFRKTVRQLLASEEIRFHLKDVIVTDLRQLEATADDWGAIESLAWASLPIAPKLRSLLSAPGWFDAADDLGRWETWLADHERVDIAFGQLAFAANDRPERVAELLRPYLGADDRWRERFIALISWSLPPGLVDFTADLIEQNVLEVPDESATPVNLWSMLYQIKDTDPGGAARLIGAHLRHSLDQARAHGHTDPFDSGTLDRHESSANVLQDIAEAAPASFTNAVVPFVIDLALTDQRDPDDRLPYGGRWKYYYEFAPAGVDGIIFAATETALIKLTAEDRDQAREMLTTFGTAESQELRFLACRALTESGEADEAIEWLLTDDRNFLLGWTGDTHWAATQLIQTHSPHCSSDRFQRIEQALLAYRSPIETRFGHRYGQYILMTALDQQRISDAVRKRLEELQRRFPGNPPAGPRWRHGEDEPHRFTIAAAQHMTDDHWLRAFRKHYDPETGQHHGLGAGHPLRLAELLGGRTTEEPERFARLALQFDTVIPAAAIEHVIRSLAHQPDFDLFADVCEHATRVYGETVGHTIGFALHDLNVRNERIIDLIDWCANAADPRPDTDFGFPNGTHQQFGGTGRLVDVGFNTTRGQAALAAASTLIEMPDQVDALAPIIARLAVDEHLAVRACAAGAVRALIKHDPDQALDLAEALFIALPDVLDAATTERLLAAAILHSPQRFATHLDHALTGPPQVTGRAGRIWARAAHVGALAASVTTDVNALPTAARLGVATAFAEHTADGLPWLPSLFNDPDAKVRARAASAMRQLARISPPDLNQLLQQFTQSTVFTDHLEHAIYGMAKLSTRLPATALQTCAKAAEAAGSNLGDIRTAHSAASRHLITVVLRLYRQGDDATRMQCLNIIDKLCESNAYGLTEALADER